MIGPVSAVTYRPVEPVSRQRESEYEDVARRDMQREHSLQATRANEQRRAQVASEAENARRAERKAARATPPKGSGTFVDISV